ncbi:MAG: S9 family peptidase [Phenylobacterium sp.]|uniref:alpha/beta hydrolase family protein n=1 Tax=Phenylobacterium sp. TaxID=1871053 RepID=UPI001A48D129|nr:S9 family peptidase [Phenylobacterium sp.]MBL8552718.1 S9 family peptidase [Phenylobacterium sp.]
MKAYLMAAAAAVSLGMAAHAAPPPASAFGRVPAVVDAAISPGGQRIAILGGAPDRRAVSIATIDQPNLPRLELGDVEGVSVRWAGDDHVLARIAFWDSFGPRQAYRFERNVVVSTDGRAITRLLESDTLSRFLLEQPVFRVTAGDRPQAIVLGLIEGSGDNTTKDSRMKRKEGEFLTALWRADPASGKGILLERGDYDTVAWSVDPAGQPRVRLDIDQINHRFSVYGKADGKGQWKQVWSGNSFKSRRYYHGYSTATDSIYLGMNDKLVAKRLDDGAETTFGQTSSQPSPSIIWDEYTDAPVGLSTGAERPNIEWFDAEIGSAHGVLARAFKSQSVRLWGWSRDRNRFLARVSSPTSPPTWFLYDRARKEVSPLGEEYPELKGAQLGSTRWITYKAADGLEIPGYLTLPPNADPSGKPLPLVVLPHGGPAVRDAYDFNIFAQFLATRGYAVLQPQYRGSWGFGQAFEDAGNGEWAGKMQTDLLDGVRALASQNLVDPNRVCIVGMDFGGYAALAGASLHPEAYRCAASIAGISDLGLFLVEEGRLYGRDGGSSRELREMLGGATRPNLDAASPARRAGSVKAPVLLIHGDKDTVVQLSQSQLMADRLKAAGKPYEFVVLEGENHYLTKSANRTRTLEALEAFLAKNLPVN